MSALPENNSSRVNTFFMMLRLLHDAAQKNDFDLLAAHIVNSSRSVLNYRSSMLLTASGKVIAAYAVPAAGNVTAAAKKSRQLIKEHRQGGETTIGDKRYIVVPLSSVRHSLSKKKPYYWVLECDDNLPENFPVLLGLLTANYGQMLWSFRRVSQLPRLLGKLFLWLMIGAILAAAIFAVATVQVNNNIAAEFVVRPVKVYNTYALFDCVIKAVDVADGATVKNNSRILEFDTERIRFQLAAAEAAYRELVAEYEQEQQAAFTDKERLPRLKILELKKAQATIAIDEAKWYLAHSVVVANHDGVITFPDSSAEKLVGRALRTGDKLFEIAAVNELIAEVAVDQKDSAILPQLPRVTLYLHTAPEVPLPATILQVRHYPELTERNVYCYKIKCRFDENVPELRLGMRGIARLSGEPLNLGYYLFRSVVLWWRGV